VVFEHFDVFALVFWFADEQPADPVSGDAVLSLGCSVLKVLSEIFDCAFVVVESFAFTEYWLVALLKSY